MDLKSGSEIPVLYYFWVKIAQNAYASKKPDAQILCPQCWGVFQGKYNQEIAVCPHCGYHFNPQIGPANNSVVTAKDGTKYKIKELIPKDRKQLPEKMYALLAIDTNGEKVYQSIQKYDTALFTEVEKKLAAADFFLPTYGLAMTRPTRHSSFRVISLAISQQRYKF